MKPVDLSSVRNPVVRDLTGWLSSQKPEDTVAGVVHAAVAAVPGANAGGITRTTRDGGVSSFSPTTTAVATLDQLQDSWLEGPCISARDEPPATGMIVVDDLDGPGGKPWPGFAAYALDAGFRSILSVQLTTDSDVCAALNLYAGAPHVFGVQAQVAAAVFAARAAPLLHDGHHDGHDDGHPMPALEDGEVIAQATGILMGRFAVDDREALAMVQRCAQDTGGTVLDVAHGLRAQALGHRRTGRRITGGATTRR